MDLVYIVLGSVFVLGVLLVCYSLYKPYEEKKAMKFDRENISKQIKTSENRRKEREQENFGGESDYRFEFGAELLESGLENGQQKSSKSAVSYYDNRESDLDFVKSKLVEKNKQLESEKNVGTKKADILKVTSVEDEKNNEKIKKELIENDNLEHGRSNKLPKNPRHTKVKEMLEMGISEDDIAEELLMGKGEVRLVAGLSSYSNSKKQ